ncbi:MAG: hypothetical protein GTN80_02960, partial [Nitrososphaeria archaeon]|nr:hypothetical protein [Nitrososphaeria archaeon]NIQ32594.1 hypothetical protein [Nitrososphaeria archaeon]
MNDDIARTTTYVSGDDGDDVLEWGEIWTFEVDYLIPDDDPNPLVNIATGSGFDRDGDPVSDDDDHSVDILPDFLKQFTGAGALEGFTAPTGPFLGTVSTINEIKTGQQIWWEFTYSVTNEDDEG